MQSPLIPLESIQIATPCRADWNAMQKVQGHDCVRFCPGCGKNVYDLSGLTRDDAMNLIAAKEGNLCLRLHRRADGTVITSDCPVGKSARIKRKGASQMMVAVVGFATATLAAGNMLLHRFSHKPNAAIALQRVAKPVAPALTPEIPAPTPFPTPIPMQEHPGEGAIITNGRIGAPSPSSPNDPSLTVTMGFPCPSSLPSPTTSRSGKDT